MDMDKMALGEYIEQEKKDGLGLKPTMTSSYS